MTPGLRGLAGLFRTRATHRGGSRLAVRFRRRRLLLIFLVGQPLTIRIPGGVRCPRRCAGYDRCPPTATDPPRPAPGRTVVSGRSRLGRWCEICRRDDPAEQRCRDHFGRVRPRWCSTIWPHPTRPTARAATRTRRPWGGGRRARGIPYHQLRPHVIQGIACSVCPESGAVGTAIGSF